MTGWLTYMRSFWRINMRITNTNLRSYCTIALVLMPFLGQYGLLSRTITLGDALLVPAVGVLILLCLAKRRLEIADRRYGFFALWFTVTSLLFSRVATGGLSSQSPMLIMQHVVYFLAVLLIVPDWFDCEKGYKIYSTFTIFLCVLLIVQAIFFAITNTSTLWVLNNKFFPHVYLSSDYTLSTQEEQIRPSSLFSEPALFAQYVVPCMILGAYKKTKTAKEYALMILVTVAVILSQSANGIVYVLVAWIFVWVQNLIKKNSTSRRMVKKRTILAYIAIVVCLPLIAQLVQNVLFNEEGFSLAIRIEEVLDTEGQSSGSMRVVRGWLIYQALTVPQKIVGIGIGNVEAYLEENSDIVHMFTSAYNGYMSGLPTILVSSGIIGGITYLLWYVRYFLNKKGVVKGLLVFMLLYLVASSSFNTPQFILTTVMIISLAKQKSTEELFL